MAATGSELVTLEQLKTSLKNLKVPFPSGTVLIDGNAGKLFAQTLSIGDEQLPLLVFAEEAIDNPGDLTALPKINTMIMPGGVGVYYHSSSGSHHISAQLEKGISVVALNANGMPLGVSAYFGLSENGEQPMIGTNVTSEGFIDPDTYLLASTDRYGLAKVDGTTVVSNNGVLSANVPEIALATDAEAKGFLGY